MPDDEPVFRTRPVFGWVGHKCLEFLIGTDIRVAPYLRRSNIVLAQHFFYLDRDDEE